MNIKRIVLIIFILLLIIICLFYNTEPTVCQKQYAECMKDLNKGVVDLFCDECDENGNYKSNIWMHPLSNRQCCKNIKTGILYNCVNRDEELIC